MGLDLPSVDVDLTSAQWYRRVLKINPNREDREDLLKKIQVLSH